MTLSVATQLFDGRIDILICQVLFFSHSKQIGETID